MLVIFFTINSFVQIVKSIISKKRKNNLFISVINSILSLTLLLIPEIPQSFFPLLFSTYLLLYGIIKFIMYLILLNNHVLPRIKYLLNAIVNFTISFIIFLFPLNHIDILLILVGIYFICLGSFLS